VTTAALGQECKTGLARAVGQVLDETGAVVVGAAIRVDGVESAPSDSQGRFRTACVGYGAHHIVISAASFEAAEITMQLSAEIHGAVVTLKPLAVNTEIHVDNTPTGVDSQDIAGSRTLNQGDLKGMADDPDEFSRELQVLAAASGGAPGEAIVTVDGFQNGGRIPAKSAIAFVRVNPDLFSSEYERPPYQGGRIEIYTKPGQDTFHGALFTTLSAGWLNAKDPFALSRAAIGKQRYGFELSGPITRNKSDFSMALEHRQVDQFAVVNAVTLDGSGNEVSTIDSVPTPQTLWSGSARVGLMPNAKNNLTAAYTADVNSLSNAGVGGTVLEQAGYDSVQSEHTVRFTNMETLSARLVHETRIGYTWRYRDDTPQSTAVSLQVAGAFTGGGVSTQAEHSHRRDLEFDDDVLYSLGKHNVKAGVEMLNISNHDTLPTNFNGTYLFGGGTAPVLNGAGTTTITGLEQYRRALLGLPGGTPTVYTATTGTPALSLDQFRIAFYAQDQWKFKARLSLSLGLRYALQSTPETLGNLGPRIGLSWAPDHAQKWVFHARTGLFYSPIDSQTSLEARRLSGSNQRELTIYSPVYGQSTNGIATITTVRAPLPHLGQTPSIQSHLGIEHDFPRHWHVQSNVYLVRAWDVMRSRNINSPTDDSPTGPRPITLNTNIYQFQQTASLHGNVLFVGVDQRSMRRLQLFAGYVRMDLRGDSDGDSSFPQSSSTDQGEVARPAWEATHHFISFSSLKLPQAVTLTTQFDAASGLPYNVTSGFDNNGDGVFNDRPVFASAGAANTYATRFGLLSPLGTGTAIDRNAGTMPWNIHLDSNLSRSFALRHPTKGDGQSVSVNLRSTNLLNHMNATSVGGVLGSPFFGIPYAADPGRRIEAGIRYSF
jgi:hypothetical protein